MKNYYDILGVGKNATNKQIGMAFREIEKDEDLSDEEFEICKEAYYTLIDSETREEYDYNLSKAQKSKSKKIKVTAFLVSLILAGSIYVLNKSSKVDKIISELPKDFKIGNFVSKNDSITSNDLKDDFVLIEVPDYTESIDEDSKFVKNITKCISAEEDFGFYMKITATEKEELDAIIYRLNAITQKMKWCSNYPLYIEFIPEDTNVKKIDLINSFNKKLKDLGWFGIFVVDSQTYDEVSGKTDANLHLTTGNKSVDKEADSYSFNKKPLGKVFGKGTIDEFFDTKIYTKDFRNFIQTNGFNQNDLEEYYIGIDVSRFQGKIDWEKTKDEIDFVILRVCDFQNYHIEDLSFSDIVDPFFKSNLDACKKYNIPYDLYYYPRATNVEEVREECIELDKYLKNCGIESKKIRFFIDVESYNSAFVKKQLLEKKQDIVNIVNEFCNQMISFGFVPGVYINESDLNMFNKIEGGLDLTSKYLVWCASYGKNLPFSVSENINEYGEIINYDIPYLGINSGVNLWGHQITDKGKFSGIDENTADVNKILKKTYDN